MKSDIRLEQLADIQHEIWAHWMKYLFEVSQENVDGSYLISTDNVFRWKRQMNTSYEHLSEVEKESDRDQARKIIHVLEVGP